VLMIKLSAGRARSKASVQTSPVIATFSKEHFKAAVA
jgi:hypothetical protein